MTRMSAVLLLQRQSRKLVKNVVDYGDNMEAILTIHPTFEYPDWDQCSVGQLLRAYGSKEYQLWLKTKAQEYRAHARARDQVMRDCGLVKVRGAMTGKVYWE